MNEEILIPIVLFSGTAVVLWKFFETRHKERMAIIEKALDPVAYKEMYSRQMFRISPLSNLKWGLIALFIGLGILCGIQLDAIYSVTQFVAPFVFISGGLALVVFYFIVAKRKD